MPGAHDALTAKIVGQAGFKALTIGGYSASASLLGKPDLSFLTLTEMVDCVRRIVDAVDIPVFTDGDTGHGIRDPIFDGKNGDKSRLGSVFNSFDAQFNSSHIGFDNKS